MWSVHASVQLEQLGVPTVTVSTDAFLGLARLQARARGLADLRFAVVAHPVGGLQPAAVAAKMETALDQVLPLLGDGDTGAASGDTAAAGHEDAGTEAGERLVDAGATAEEVNDYFDAHGWTDGLPILAPTAELVDRFVAASGFDPNTVIASIPPNDAAATVERIATNCVMAGCRPEYLPIVIAAVRAISAPEFNLASIQATTHSGGILTFVSGPLAQDVGMNWADGLFGPGNRANASIGRALRLLLRNLGGAKPGVGDMSTQGSPAMYGYCAAEHIAANPWDSLQVEHGYSPEDSTVTVLACENPHNVQDHSSTSAVGILTILAGSMTQLGSNHVMTHGGEPMVVFGPEHAATVAGDGYSKDDVRRFLFERLRVPMASCSQDWHDEFIEGQLLRDTGQAEWIPVVEKPDDIWIAVGGGSGKHSCWIPTWGSGSHTVMQRIDAADGAPLR